ncbi:MAG: TonB-dependent receptor [Candidatus Koribacter versatilis]|nr:TonB-dependent receptor [Candidatus Koribacter versatilis]
MEQRLRGQAMGIPGHRVLLFGWLLLSCAYAQNQTSQRITITVVDENGVAIAAARVALTSSDGLQSLHCQTSPAGMCTLAVQGASPYKARVEKENFYATEAGDLHLDQSNSLELTLVHQREVREVVNVVESPPAINPEQVNAQEQISGVDVINLPYPATRDYRNALNYIPQLVNDIYTQPHITGAETYQTLVSFDGFNVTQPANGQLLLRVSTDAFRSVNVQTSRVSAQYGKGSGGVLELNTATGDDHFRFAATDFIPSVQNKRGITLDKLNPRFTTSGPIVKGRVWFFDAADAEYANIIVTELKPGNDHDVFWRVGNLFKVQGNLTSRNILTSSFNVNFAHDRHSGMSLENPPATTPAINQSMYQGSLKDQYYFSSGQLLETGFGFNRYDFDQVPRGTDPYYFNPDTAGGSYYFTAHTQADRWQLYSNLFLKPLDWHGNHQFKVGLDLDRLRYDFNFLRQPISYLRTVEPLPPDGCKVTPVKPSPCSRYSEFSGPSFGERHNLEVSGYAQDRWLITNRFLLEAGLRFDWDEIIRHGLFSPRLAATYVLSQSANTKFSAGLGVFHDATPMFLFARPEAGTRIDNFYDPSGNLISGQITSVFSINRATPEASRYLNWSVGLEQKLPGQMYLKAEFIQKRGTNGFAYNWINPVDLGPPGVQNYTAQFQLRNHREDHFHSFEINLRRVFEKGHLIMGSYIRSRSRSSQVLDFNVDNPVFNTQQPGPYPWDAPNRFLSWGFLPLVKGFDFGYSTEFRTGFPFYLLDNQQQLAPLPGTQTIPSFLRFPQYFTLNTHLEKRFRAFGFFWAIRGGFDNLTARKNYGNVNHNVDSPQFLTFSGHSGRAFTGRIRFLGRK